RKNRNCATTSNRWKSGEITNTWTRATWTTCCRVWVSEPTRDKARPREFITTSRKRITTCLQLHYWLPTTLRPAIRSQRYSSSSHRVEKERHHAWNGTTGYRRRCGTR